VSGTSLSVCNRAAPALRRASRIIHGGSGMSTGIATTRLYRRHVTRLQSEHCRRSRERALPG